jgi:putative endonuclease
MTSGKFNLYIARCKDNSLYIGSTSLKPPRRIERHNSGAGAKWFLQHGLGIVAYTEEYPTLVEARRREVQIKKWSRAKKERLIAGLKP